MKPDETNYNIFCVDIGELLVIEEFCPYGNLRDYLIANEGSFINELMSAENSSTLAWMSHSGLNSGQLQADEFQE